MLTRKLLILIFCLHALSMFGQSGLLGVSGTYGLAVNEIPPQTMSRMAGGLQASLEYPYRHFSFGGELVWMSVGAYNREVFPVSPASSKPGVVYSIKNNQLEADLLARYYVKESLKGFYVGVMLSFAYQLLRTQGYPEDGAYPALNQKFQDNYFRGGGLTYGYRFRFSPQAGGHLFLRHQMIWNNNNPDIWQQSHLAGFGLHFLL